MDPELQALQRLNYDTDAPNWDLLSQKLSSISTHTNSNKNDSKSQALTPDIQRNASYFLSKIAELEDELRAERSSNSKLKLSAESISTGAVTPQKGTPRDDNDSNLSDMITKLKDENSTLITRLDAAKNTNLSLKSLITATEANCKAKVAELEEKVNNKEKQYNELKQKCDSLTSKYTNKAVQLENDIQILKASVNENDSKKTVALENEIKELHSKVEEIQTNTMNLEDEKLQLSQQLEDLKSSIQEVLTINKKQETTLATQAQTIESLQSIIQSLKQKAEDRNEKCKILQHYGIEKRNEIAQQSIIVNSFNERIRLYEGHLMSYEDIISQQYELQCLKSELELLKAAEDNARSSVMKGWMEYLDMPPPTGIQFEDKAVTTIFETWSNNPTRRSQLTRWFNTCHTIENLNNDRGLELTDLTPEVANGFLLIILPELKSILKDTSNIRIFTREKVIRQMDLRISISEGNYVSPTFTSFHKTIHETEDEPIIVKT